MSAEPARQRGGGPLSALAALGRGAVAPFEGLRFVTFDHPELVRIWIWPILLTGLVVCLVYGAAFAFYDDLTEALWPSPAGGVWAWVHGAVEILVLLLLWAVGIVVVILLSNLLGAPFHDRLSERVEALRGGRPAPTTTLGLVLGEAVRSVAYELIKVLLYLAVMVPVLLVGLVPGVGTTVSVVVGFLFTTLYLAMDFVDWPVARRQEGNVFRFRLLTRYPASMFGFGCSVWLLLSIPVLQMLFVPGAVAGGTLLYLDLEKASAGAPSSEAHG
ncbi:MAG: EI24 domain-containing protein [Sandaracinaceae bacterium]